MARTQVFLPGESHGMRSLDGYSPWSCKESDMTESLTLSFSWWFSGKKKNLPAMQETRVQSLGWEDPLEKEMATHSSILACEIPKTEEPHGLQFLGLQKSQT